MPPTVLITGASQGSGKATALLFARKGYNVVLAARQADRLESVAQAVREIGVSALAIPTDVSQIEAVQKLVEQSLGFYDQIDVLVNNAGICLTGEMANTSLEDWQQIMNVNFWGYVYTIQALLPHFLERQQGTIVNVGSFGGKMPLPNMTAYCASKYAITGMTETLRLELTPKAIHVGIVHPGIINSDFLERAVFKGTETDTQKGRQRMQEILQGPIVSQPEEIAQAVWDVVRFKVDEKVVGPIMVATEAYRLFPGLTQWMLEQGVMGS
ncbi:SDR family oxidoreductase [Desertifilum sp. FACHB-1129]|uniref:Oxidoreductase n=1 Tax=Desertifilum tharense IPPAS B-1220 TaxID=1781255 RepID=A0A1E5QLA8_9CYAN|nr:MULTISPECIES: SDR family oxidoreductase [Desertifilum]MDA0212853.1 SDR family NAD(P)-dependent oxidoreductase [Cyanobacteria bacterium FC1]MBD2311444.1 SDR family oxidoreductase [Desertifilum sp. FACHB-1129]MBD2321690.1 SDR family oxidoreductase [Desertifilum sp. FACHB-866]MBD2331817.1 SDR family oxidoreductase [Desertifilum sp. FACHB-868]OEJ75391.1 oxidoreductase [Desertifilum tharense IPPAS B-1220]